MLPTLARRTDIEALTSGYGQIIVDECHHLTAGAYAHSVKKITAQLWLGLTATPRRRDGLDDLVRWQLGPVRHTVTEADPGALDEAAANNAGPKRELHLHQTSFRYDGMTDPTAPGGMAEIYRSMVSDQARNQMIVNDVCTALLTQLPRPHAAHGPWRLSSPCLLPAVTKQSCYAVESRQRHAETRWPGSWRPILAMGYSRSGLRRTSGKASTPQLSTHSFSPRRSPSMGS